tara:strand:+ start:166 stop:564 length:399 start_codon:yes stop_codon:yes gene_type:complete
VSSHDLTLASFINLLEYFSDNPQEYLDFIYETSNSNRNRSNCFDQTIVRPVTNPDTQEQELHLAYDAEVQYKRKPKQNRLILCNPQDSIKVGEPVMITYHSGMKCYKHSRKLHVSNADNCIGGFYYTNGSIA